MSQAFAFTRRRAAVALTAAALLGASPWAAANEQAPDAFIRSLSESVLQTLRDDPAIQAGDTKRIMAVVDSQIMPSVNFTRMTASATGPGWRRASPEQRQRLQTEFKTLLVHTYAGALKQVKNQTVEVQPLRGKATDAEVLVRTLVRGGSEPVQLDYRLERTPGQGQGWKIYDLNVMGVWLVDTYLPQFSSQINASGMDGLIQTLAERNRSNAGQ